MTDCVVVFGTRPEAIKLGPVVAELRTLGIQPDVVATGQHWDLLRGTPAESDLAGCHSLGLASDGNVMRWQTRAEVALSDWLAEHHPKVVVVQGDTMSALAGARAAVGLKVPVAHVEAGLRSHNLHDPWPEEAARVALARLATWHYAPTGIAALNLANEGIPESQVVVTGNTVVSALERYAFEARPVDEPENLVVVTMHRREIQTPVLASRVWGQVYQLAMRRPELRVFWPVHPAFAKVLGSGAPVMPPNVTLSGPMPYAAFATVVARAKLVITDSGGLVEEAATLGVPMVIWRAVNDRPEAVEAEIAVLCDPAGELEPAVKRALRLTRVVRRAFGFPDAAQQVAQHIAGLL